MKRLLTAVLLTSTLAFAADKPAEAKPDPKLVAEGAKLFAEKTCLACHGKDAKTPIMPDYPKLAGQNALYAEKQMLDIKSGARSNGNTAAMKGIMPLVNEAEIKALAAYLASLK
ncbi:MAG: c-type cytochrome [Myxococcota bacterium]